MVVTNPASGMMLEDRRRDDELRKVYSDEDINRIMSNLPDKLERPDRYWIPLIGLYSGLRLDEICQLYVDDVQKVDDIWCLSVNDEHDKKCKNDSSKRIVPVHPNLVRLGFIEYVEGLKNSSVPRLWMNLTWRKEDGYSNGFGKWYQRYNRQYVSDDPKKVFHSMRHLVADTLKQKGVAEVVISEILGHTHQSITSGRYGKRYQPKVLLEALVKLDYGIAFN